MLMNFFRRVSINDLTVTKDLNLGTYDDVDKRSRMTDKTKCLAVGVLFVGPERLTSAYMFVQVSVLQSDP